MNVRLARPGAHHAPRTCARRLRHVVRRDARGVRGTRGRGGARSRRQRRRATGWVGCARPAVDAARGASRGRAGRDDVDERVAAAVPAREQQRAVYLPRRHRRAVRRGLLPRARPAACDAPRRGQGQLLLRAPGARRRRHVHHAGAHACALLGVRCLQHRHPVRRAVSPCRYRTGGHPPVGVQQGQSLLEQPLLLLLPAVLSHDILRRRAALRRACTPLAARPPAFLLLGGVRRRRSLQVRARLGTPALA
eukprot:scaffold831_cov336-Prasinococcus_capsulatus_cf.AAC.7